MNPRRLACWTCLLLVLGLTACPRATQEQPAATRTTAGHAGNADSPSATPLETAPIPGAGDNPGKRRIRTGGPLPPQRMPGPVELDHSCHSDADCTVKDVGSCCGTYPACVNIDSPTDPAAVQAQCAREGKISTCGFQEISACTCVRGSCRGLTPAIEPPVDPAPQPPAER